MSEPGKAEEREEELKGEQRALPRNRCASPVAIRMGVLR
jgi:hypothetical protein